MPRKKTAVAVESEPASDDLENSSRSRRRGTRINYAVLAGKAKTKTAEKPTKEKRPIEDVTKELNEAPTKPARQNLKKTAAPIKNETPKPLGKMATRKTPAKGRDGAPALEVSVPSRSTRAGARTMKKIEKDEPIKPPLNETKEQELPAPVAKRRGRKPKNQLKQQPTKVEEELDESKADAMDADKEEEGQVNDSLKKIEEDEPIKLPLNETKEQELPAPVAKRRGRKPKNQLKQQPTEVEDELDEIKADANKEGESQVNDSVKKIEKDEPIKPPLNETKEQELPAPVAKRRGRKPKNQLLQQPTKAQDELDESKADAMDADKEEESQVNDSVSEEKPVIQIRPDKSSPVIEKPVEESQPESQAQQRVTRSENRETNQVVKDEQPEIPASEAPELDSTPEAKPRGRTRRDVLKEEPVKPSEKLSDTVEKQDKSVEIMSSELPVGKDVPMKEIEDETLVEESQSPVDTRKSVSPAKNFKPGPLTKSSNAYLGQEIQKKKETPEPEASPIRNESEEKSLILSEPEKLLPSIVQPEAENQTESHKESSPVKSNESPNNNLRSDSSEEKNDVTLENKSALEKPPVSPSKRRFLQLHSPIKRFKVPESQDSTVTKAEEEEGSVEEANSAKASDASDILEALAEIANDCVPPIEEKEPEKRTRGGRKKKESVTSEGSETTDIYCICRKPFGKKPMIGCDGCNEWYHRACIKMSAKEFKQISDSRTKWFCADCIKAPQEEGVKGKKKSSIETKIAKDSKKSVKEAKSTVKQTKQSSNEEAEHSNQQSEAEKIEALKNSKEIQALLPKGIECKFQTKQDGKMEIIMAVPTDQWESLKQQESIMKAKALLSKEHSKKAEGSDAKLEPKSVEKIKTGMQEIKASQTKGPLGSVKPDVAKTIKKSETSGATSNEKPIQAVKPNAGKVIKASEDSSTVQLKERKAPELPFIQKLPDLPKTKIMKKKSIESTSSSLNYLALKEQLQKKPGMLPDRSKSPNIPGFLKNSKDSPFTSKSKGRLGLKNLPNLGHGKTPEKGPETAKGSKPKTPVSSNKKITAEPVHRPPSPPAYKPCLKQSLEPPKIIKRSLSASQKPVKSGFSLFSKADQTVKYNHKDGQPQRNLPNLDIQKLSSECLVCEKPLVDARIGVTIYCSDDCIKAHVKKALKVFERNGKYTAASDKIPLKDFRGAAMPENERPHKEDLIKCLTANPLYNIDGISGTKTSKIKKKKGKKDKHVKEESKDEKQKKETKPDLGVSPLKSVDSKHAWREKFASILKQRLNELRKDPSVSGLENLKEDELDERAKKIIKGLSKAFHNNSEKLAAQARKIYMNLSNPRCVNFQVKVLKNEIKAKKFYSLTAEDMAPSELQKWREEERKHDLEMMVKDAGDSQGVFIKKTHKGEEVLIAIDDDMAMRDEFLPKETQAHHTPHWDDAGSGSPSALAKFDSEENEKDKTPTNGENDETADDDGPDTTANHSLPDHVFEATCKICTGQQASQSGGYKKFTSSMHIVKPINDSFRHDDDVHEEPSPEKSRSPSPEMIEPDTPPGSPPRVVAVEEGVAPKEKITADGALTKPYAWAGIVVASDEDSWAAHGIATKGRISELRKFLPQEFKVLGKIGSLPMRKYYSDCVHLKVTLGMVIRPTREQDEEAFASCVKKCLNEEKSYVIRNLKVKDMYLVPLKNLRLVPPALEDLVHNAAFNESVKSKPAFLVVMIGMDRLHHSSQAKEPQAVAEFLDEEDEYDPESELEADVGADMDALKSEIAAEGERMEASGPDEPMEVTEEEALPELGEINLEQHDIDKLVEELISCKNDAETGAVFANLPPDLRSKVYAILQEKVNERQRGESDSGDVHQQTAAPTASETNQLSTQPQVALNPLELAAMPVAAKPALLPPPIQQQPAMDNVSRYGHRAEPHYPPMAHYHHEPPIHGHFHQEHAPPAYEQPPVYDRRYSPIPHERDRPYHRGHRGEHHRRRHERSPRSHHRFNRDRRGPHRRKNSPGRPHSRHSPRHGASPRRSPHQHSSPQRSPLPRHSPAH